MRSMSFTVELPDSVAEALRLAPADAEAEVRKELALALYARGILGFGKARELCGKGSIQDHAAKAVRFRSGFQPIPEQFPPH
jgi:hypothetical protein